MTLGANSVVTLRNTAQIEVAPAGTLKMHSDNIFLEDLNTKVVVYGTLEILNDEDFDVFGSGKFVFAPGSQLTLGNGAKFAVTGNGLNDVKVQLLANTSLDLQDHTISLQNCEIQMGDNSKLLASNNEIAFDRVSFTGISKTATLEFDQLIECDIRNSFFKKMDRGLKITNTTNEVIIYDVEFINNKIGLEVNNVEDLKIYKSAFNAVSNNTGEGIRANSLNKLFMIDADFNTLLTGASINNIAPMIGQELEFENNTFSNIGANGVSISNNDLAKFTHCTFDNNTTGIDAINCSDINFNNGKLINNDYGVYLTDVSKMSFNSGQHLFFGANNLIDNNIMGILGASSTVFISNKTIVSNNITGVNMLGQSINDHMLVVGDLGCVSIIDNNTAIEGTDFFLDIDAQIHACNRGNCNNILPINFSGNTKMFDVCYNNSTSNGVLARENYWGIINGQASGINGFNYFISNGCSSNNVTISDNNFRSNSNCGRTYYVLNPSILTTIVRLPNYTNFKSNNYVEEDYNYYINEVSEINDLALEKRNSSRIKLPKVNNRTVADVFEQGYRNYLSENKADAHYWLTFIAELNVNKQKEKQAMYLIVKAKNLVKIIDSRPLNRGKKADNDFFDDNEFSENYDIKIVPNPIKDNLFITTKSNKWYDIEVYDIAGNILAEEKFFNKASLDVSGYSSGVYFVKLYNDEKELIKSMKVLK